LQPEKDLITCNFLNILIGKKGPPIAVQKRTWSLGTVVSNIVSEWPQQISPTLPTEMLFEIGSKE